MEDLHMLAARIIIDGLRDIGIVKGEVMTF